MIFGTRYPIVQAPMAGVQAGALAAAVSEAGGLGSLPCAMLTAQTLRTELQAIHGRVGRRVNVNFSCHEPPVPDDRREAAWREALAPYYREFGIEGSKVPAGPGRAPFTAEMAQVLEGFRPEVVSFHFGLPCAQLLARVKS